VSESQFLQEVKQNQGIIYKLVGLYALDDEDKKDMYQEVLLQAWRAWPQFRGEAKFSTWLYRICLNTILTLARKKRKIDYRESLETLSPVIESHTVQREEAQRLYLAIRRLAETDRAIISMHLDGYENSEIAAVTGISNNNVAVKLHRIKQSLANFLKH
jgi:RNA polymerase sigma-70 factor (ECF subfamily)